MPRLARALSLLAVLLWTTAAFAQALPAAKPEQVGLSSERLARIGQVVKADVEKGRLPGAVVLVARKGKVAYFEEFGFRDKATGAPMTKDAIFRIYSMTKPFTSVAVMMLVEEGRIQLSDPVSKYLPALGKLQVGMERFDAATGKQVFYTVATDREMTIHDLLRHTSGLTYGVFGKSAVKDLYKKESIDGPDHTNAELIDKLAKVPLAYQPGTTWEYSRSTDVLGRVIEVVADTTLGQFLETRIFQPLKMADSGFWVAAAKQGRVAEPFAKDPDSGNPIKLLDVTVARKYESGGGGGVATAMDYARFAQMMLNGGRLDNVRLLGRKTVELMTSDHLGRVTGPSFSPGAGHGFGLGFAVRLEPGMGDTAGSKGEFFWGGFGGTAFWVDPKEELVAVWMMQAPSQLGYYRRVFKTLVEASLVD
jgi:CubicO group peptidase (beta-lactamase class C family)